MAPGDITGTLTKNLVQKYIRGCHILHFHGIVDAYGHLSYRISDDVFFMSRYMAPALVSSETDLILYRVKDGESLQENAPKGVRSPAQGTCMTSSSLSVGFSERYIHSEIYKPFPKVKSAVHSHSLDVVPFSISQRTSLRACFHMAGFLGTEVPVWAAATVYREDDSIVQSMLVGSTRLGASLAQSLGVKPVDGSSGDNIEGLPKHPVVLMRGHGFVCTAESIEMAVSKCICTAQNARVQLYSLQE